MQQPWAILEIHDSNFALTTFVHEKWLFSLAACNSKAKFDKAHKNLSPMKEQRQLRGLKNRPISIYEWKIIGRIFLDPNMAVVYPLRSIMIDLQ